MNMIYNTIAERTPFFLHLLSAMAFLLSFSVLVWDVGCVRPLGALAERRRNIQGYGNDRIHISKSRMKSMTCVLEDLFTKHLKTRESSQ